MSASIGPVPVAAVDIGSNTTRLLVAEAVGGRPRPILEQRSYTLIKQAKRRGRIGDAKAEEVARAVATQVSLARELRADPIRIVATAAVRDACDGQEVIGRVADAAGIGAEVISEREEGRLAFLGATRTLVHPVSGPVLVLDIGGGSSEVVLGTVPEGARWVRSIPVGSGSLTESCVRRDPPGPRDLDRLREEIAAATEGLKLPRTDHAIAVGGSSSSLRRLVGSELDAEATARALEVLTSMPSEGIARRFEVDARRARMLPAGVLVLERLIDLHGGSLVVGRGGLREGIAIELLARRGDLAAAPRLAA